LAGYTFILEIADVDIKFYFFEPFIHFLLINSKTVYIDVSLFNLDYVFAAKRRKRLKLRDANKQTPLSCAASNNRVNVVKYLVRELEKLGESIFSADMKDGDAEKSHPIHRACVEGHLDVVKILCSHCVDLKLRPELSMFAPNHHGQTILHLAAENRHVDICKYLLTLPGCQVQKGVKDKNDLTPGDLARPHHDLAQILRQADTVAP